MSEEERESQGTWARRWIWTDALSSRDGARDTTSDREHHVPVCKRRADSVAQSGLTAATGGAVDESGRCAATLDLWRATIRISTRTCQAAMEHYHTTDRTRHGQSDSGYSSMLCKPGFQVRPEQRPM
ncbi:hypothetical protein MN608_08067 [Microdochium nivale]|nr:hypothetical protein MN608_08067 [Microdochium nivale]